MIEVLDSLIREYKENVKQCLEKIQPLADALQPPIASMEFQKAEEISQLFPPSVTVNPSCLAAEFEIFPQVVHRNQDVCLSVSDLGKMAYKHKSIFPCTHKVFKLLFTAPIGVPKDERTFGEMNIIKNFLPSTTSDGRLEDLIFLAAEKDLTDKLDLDEVLKVWISKKNPKLKIKL